MRVTKFLMVPALSLALLPVAASAGTSYARAEVLDVTPVYRTVSHRVPREQCYEEQVAYSEPRRAGSATAPILGAIIGGALGNAVGHSKTNKKVGTAVGAVLGGSIGADISRRQRYENGTVRYRTEQVCSVVEDTYEEQELDGYDVTYRFAGDTYTTRMHRDPGDSIRVRVSVTPAG